MPYGLALVCPVVTGPACCYSPSDGACCSVVVIGPVVVGPVVVGPVVVEPVVVAPVVVGPVVV